MLIDLNGQVNVGVRKWDGKTIIYRDYEAEYQ